MTAFSIILAIVIIILIGNFYRLAKKNNFKAINIFENLQGDLVSGLFSSKNLNFNNRNLFNVARHFFYSISTILLVIMAFSGFLLPLFWKSMEGILLFIHLIIAPFFVVSIVLALALFANVMQFNSGDYEYLSGHKKSAVQKWSFLKKLNFWLFSIAIIFNIGSILFAMYPLFGTSGQNWLLNIHRYSALILFVLMANYLTVKYTMKK